MSLFKASLYPFVAKQLTARESVIRSRVNGNNTNQELAWLTAKTAWIRMSSSINIEDDQLARLLGIGKGNALAKQHVMMGGELLLTGEDQYRLRAGIGDGGGAYGDANNRTRTVNSGFRPMAGIKGLSVASKGVNGSLRTLSLQFDVWTKEEFDRLEALYLRTGYSVLIEWGWSITPTGDKPSYFNILDKNPTKEAIFDELYRVAERPQSPLHTGPYSNSTKPGFIEARNGNYDAFYGLVKNFNWSIDSANMGYHCTVEVVSVAEVLESFKINYVSRIDARSFLDSPDTSSIPGNFSRPNDPLGLAPLKPVYDPLPEDLSKAYMKNKLTGLFTHIKQKMLQDSFSIKTFSMPVSVPYYEGGRQFNYPALLQSLPIHTTKNSDWGLYMRLRDIIDIFNRHLIIHSETGPIVRLSVDDEIGNELLGFGHYFQSTTDVTKCIIKPCSDEKLLRSDLRLHWLDNFDGTNFDWFIQDGKYNKTRIGNLMINTDLLVDSLNNTETDKTGSIDLIAYFNKVLGECSKVLGGVNDLCLYADPVRPLIYVVDKAYVEDDSERKGKYQFKINTPTSIVRNVTMDSSVFPDQMKMIAIGAQVGGGSGFGIDVTSFDQFNRGLVDRIIQRKIEPGTLNPANSIENDQERRRRLSLTANTIYQYNRYLKPGAFANELSTVEPPTQFLADLIALEIEEQLKNGHSTHAGRTVLPIRFGLVMDGIAGFQIGQVFTINRDVLPASYSGLYDSESKSRIGFIIKSVNQLIDTSDWTTQIEAQTVILDSEYDRSAITESILMSQLHIFVKGKEVN